MVTQRAPGSGAANQSQDMQVEVWPQPSRPKRVAESGPGRPAEAAPDRDNGHGRACEKAGHLTTAFASGRSDSKAGPGPESRAFTVDRADRGLSSAAAGRGSAER